MIDDDLKEQLRRWGYATVTRYAANDDGPSLGDSVLVHVREMGAGPKQQARDDRDLVKRDGDARLRHMARYAGIKGLTKLPAWSCDPIRARNDADRPHTRHAVVDIGIPDDLRWVDRALASMARTHLLRSIIVRTEFTVSASRTVKARMACDAYEREMAKRLGIALPPKSEEAEEVLTVRQYRYELGLALEWMRGKLAA